MGSTKRISRQVTPRSGKAVAVRVSRHEQAKPAGYLLDGARFASLRQILDPKTPTLNLVELNTAQVRDLVIRRLELAPDAWRIGMMGIGMVDKHRAIAEVRADSRVGRYLIEIERYVLDAVTGTAPKRKRSSL